MFLIGLRLKAEIYPETINVLQKLKEKDYTIAALTDLPSAMPDEIFRRDPNKFTVGIHCSSSVFFFIPYKNQLCDRKGKSFSNHLQAFLWEDIIQGNNKGNLTCDKLSVFKG